MKQKNIIKSCIIIIVLIVMCIGGNQYYKYKCEKDRLKKSPYFTELHISLDTIIDMKEGYCVKMTPELPPYGWGEWYRNLDRSIWPDYSAYKIEATDDTNKVVVVLNYDLFHRKSKFDNDGINRAKELGFSDENEITVDWVMNHPTEAVSILQGMESHGDKYFGVLNYRYTTYEKIINGEIDTIDKENESADNK